MTTFKIANLTMEDGTEGHLKSGVFYFTNLGDWRSGAESKTPANERAQADGAHSIGSDYRSSAVFTVTGWYKGESWVDVLTMIDEFNRNVVRRIPTKVTVTEEIGPRSRIVSVRASPVRENKLAKDFSFAIDMLATDALRYGEPMSASTGVRVSGGGLAFPLGTNPAAYWNFGADGSSGRVSALNSGTAAVYPTLSASGGLGDGFVVTNVSTGDEVRFERPIPLGSTVSINQRTGMATIDGQSDVSGFITRRNFFAIPPGETHQIQFAALGMVEGIPQFTVSWAPAFH